MIIVITLVDRLAPWEFEFPFPSSLIYTLLDPALIWTTLSTRGHMRVRLINLKETTDNVALSNTHLGISKWVLCTPGLRLESLHRFGVQQSQQTFSLCRKLMIQVPSRQLLPTGAKLSTFAIARITRHTTGQVPPRVSGEGREILSIFGVLPRAA